MENAIKKEFIEYFIKTHDGLFSELMEYQECEDDFVNPLSIAHNYRPYIFKDKK